MGRWGWAGSTTLWRYLMGNPWKSTMEIPYRGEFIHVFWKEVVDFPLPRLMFEGTFQKLWLHRPHYKTGPFGGICRYTVYPMFRPVSGRWSYEFCVFRIIIIEKYWFCEKKCIYIYIIYIHVWKLRIFGASWSIIQLSRLHLGSPAALHGMIQIHCSRSLPAAPRTCVLACASIFDTTWL